MKLISSRWENSIVVFAQNYLAYCKSNGVDVTLSNQCTMRRLFSIQTVDPNFIDNMLLSTFILVATSICPWSFEIFAAVNSNVAWFQALRDYERSLWYRLVSSTLLTSTRTSTHGPSTNTSTSTWGLSMSTSTYYEYSSTHASHKNTSIDRVPVAYYMA